MLNRITTVEEIKDAISYIGERYKSTPYLYVNILKYGLGTENVVAWFDKNKNNQIDGIYLLYYDCIHFYTNDLEGYPIEKLLDFADETAHKVIMLQGEIGNRVERAFQTYYSERNYVIDMDKCGLEDRVYQSQIAEREDIPQIVDLLMADPEYINVYDRNVLSKQLFDRFDGNFSRFFVVKMDGKIVATCSTYGEVPGFALVGGVIVHPDYRRRGLAGDVENYACHILNNEHISRVGFVNFHNAASLALHEKLGAFSIAVLAKFVKK
ncbi:MAG: GNAT family N-acetyltransferase [Thermoguttaceae bacterium]|nr:GNAT family N-acetyltransferase [Thermoguttaceae bacterium]